MLSSSQFTPASEPSPVPSADPDAFVHALDVFRTAEPEATWVVGCGWDGLPRLLPASDVAGAVADDLAVHRASSDVGPRTLIVSELYLFAMESLEQRVDVPGPNDPVALHGKLVGPFLSDQAPAVTPGQLRLTRADVLEGVVRSLRQGFHYGRKRDEGAEARHCYHAWVAGAPEEELAQGRGMVLVYPMGDVVEKGEPGNEPWIRELCFDLLAAFQEDLQAAGDPSALAEATLPVPDLTAHKAELKLQGVKLDGNDRLEGAPEGSSWFKKLYYSMFPARTPLPPEGSTLCYVALAHMALEAVPGWPTPAIHTLWSRVSTPQVFWTAELADGLRPVRAVDGGFSLHEGALKLDKPEYRFETDAKGALKSSDYSYLSFDVNDRFAAEAGASLEIEFQYLDDGHEAFAIEYVATTGQTTTSAPVPRSNSDTWRSSTVVLDDAQFDNGLDGGADFRFRCGPSDRDLSLRRVVVRKPNTE